MGGDSTMIDTRHCFRLRIYETSASIAEYASTAKCNAKARYTGSVLECRVWRLQDGGFTRGYGDKNPESLFQTNKLGAIPKKDYK